MWILVQLKDKAEKLQTKVRCLRHVREQSVIQCIGLFSLIFIGYDPHALQLQAQLVYLSFAFKVSIQLE